MIEKFLDNSINVAEEVPTKVAADKAYQNAMHNNDKPTARIEHDRAQCFLGF